MAGTQYGALNFTLEEEKKQASPLRKSGAVAAVVVAVCVMFFAGRVHKSLTTPFSHEEVMNVASTCTEGQFIGGCTECQKCGASEYRNGGCTLFKDTFCSFCDPISHCPRQNQRCAEGDKKVVTTCTACECLKGITEYDQKTLEQIEYQSDTWSKEQIAMYKAKDKQFSCFFNNDTPWSAGANQVFVPAVPTTECRACTVCPKQFYQKTACNTGGDTGKDTVCAACTVCEAFEYTEKPCRYGADTVCGKCTNCSVQAGAAGTFLWQKKECSAKKNKQVYTPGSPTVCAPCAGKPKSGKFYIAKPCAAGKYETQFGIRGNTHSGPVYVADSARDTEFAKCTVCTAGNFVNKACDAGLKTCLNKASPTIDDSAWNALVAAKAVKGEDQSKQCGQYKMGHDEQCTACSKNAGCGEPGSVKCGEGESTQTTENSEISIVSFRTRVCKSDSDPTPVGFGDATYDTCKTCKSSEYVKRNCSPQCASFSKEGQCSHNGDTCETDAACGDGNFCDNQCKLVPSGKQEEKEDGTMEVNTRGVQVGCLKCKDNFLIGDGVVSKKPGRMKSAAVCDDANKKCQEYARKGADVKYGMKLAPEYSTCNNNCNDDVQFKKFANCCKDKSLGSACEWERSERACLTEFQSLETGKAMGKPYLVRSAGSNYKGYQQGGLDTSGDSPKRFPLIDRSEGAFVFVRWCREMCEDHADCQMFSVKTAHADADADPATAKEITESTQCKLYKDTPEAYAANKQAAPLADAVLAAMDTKEGKGWTCAQGAAVNSWHQGKSGIPAEAGFKCDGSKMGIDQVASCKNDFCIGDSQCCVQSEDLCYRKDQQFFVAKQE